MTEQTKQKLKYWIIGLFTGGAVAAPVTAFVCKNIYEKKIEEASIKATESAYNQGINDMAEYAVTQAASENRGLTGPNRGISEAQSGSLDNDTDPREYDTTIDEEEEALDEEAHQRYMDIIERNKYGSEDDQRPYIISVDKYENEMYMKKSCVNWYDKDDVFEEELVVVEDPYKTFGVVSGKDLFADVSGREDPNVCYVRNERALTDFEITRIRGSYAEIVGGEANLGETDT